MDWEKGRKLGTVQCSCEHNSLIPADVKYLGYTIEILFYCQVCGELRFFQFDKMKYRRKKKDEDRL